MKPPTPLLEVVSGATDADPEIEGLLRAAREWADPLPENRERVSRALGAALPVAQAALGPSALPATGAPHAAAPQSSGAAGSVSAQAKPGTSAVAALRVGGLLVGGLLLGGLGFWLGHDLGYSKGVAQALREQLGQAAARELAPVAASSSSGAQPDPVAALRQTPASPAAEPRAASTPPRTTPTRKHALATGVERARARASASPSPDSTGTSPALTFGQALEQLRRAQQQLRGGQAAMSLLVLSELDRVAGELLREEREATRVLALCAVGQEKDARTVARRLEQSSPGSIYAMRLSKSCAGEPSLDDVQGGARAGSDDGLLGGESAE
jgi:hypothetical protein